MFLKISKVPIEVYCQIKNSKGAGRVRVGTSYSFALVESSRAGGKTSHKSVAGLGSYSRKEYLPVSVASGTSALGTACKKVYVNSFNVEDPTSFRKVNLDPPVRFYHTFCRQLGAAAAEYNISLEDLRKYAAQVLAIIPLYDISDYTAYTGEEAKERIRKEINRPGDQLDRILNQDTFYELYDYVMLRDGILVPIRNNLRVKLEYEFRLV